MDIMGCENGGRAAKGTQGLVERVGEGTRVKIWKGETATQTA